MTTENRTKHTAGSLATRMLGADPATRERYQSRHDAMEPGGAVARLLEAIQSLLVELPKSTPSDGSVDPMSYAYAIGLAKQAIADVERASA